MYEAYNAPSCLSKHSFKCGITHNDNINFSLIISESMNKGVDIIKVFGVISVALFFFFVLKMALQLPSGVSLKNTAGFMWFEKKS